MKPNDNDEELSDEKLRERISEQESGFSGFTGTPGRQELGPTLIGFTSSRINIGTTHTTRSCLVHSTP